MSDVIVFKPGGYRYIKGGFQFSSGVAAETGFEIERARLLRPLPLGAGFAAVGGHLSVLARPSTALAPRELRSPRPFPANRREGITRRDSNTPARWGLSRHPATPV